MIDHSKEDNLLPFNPHDPEYRWKLRVRVVMPASSRWHIYWGRIVFVVCTLIISGWLGTAGAAWAFVRFEHGYTDARFLDLAFYPFRSAHYHTGLGQHYLAQGRAEFENKNYATGYQLLLNGLALVPDDVAARRLVAYTQIRLGHTDLALKTLAGGALLATADLDYLKSLFALLHELQEDETVITFAQQLLPSAPDTGLTHQFIALQVATAHFERGRYDAAERLLIEWRLTDSPEGAILLARCDWARGYPDFALARLGRELTRFPKHDELSLYVIRFHRELGHSEEARRLALLRQLNEPASPGPRIDLLYSLHAAPDREAEARELAAYLTAFKADVAALDLLARFAVDTIQPTLATKAHDLAVAQNAPLNAFNLARVQAAIAAQEFRNALTLADAAIHEQNEGDPNFLPTVNALRALAYFGLKDTSRADLLLTAYLNQTRLRAADALSLAKQLRLLGATSSARDVLARATVADSLNQATLAELIRLDAESGNRTALSENLPKLLRLQKPSRPALEETLLRLDQRADAPLRDQIRAALARVPATPNP